MSTVDNGAPAAATVSFLFWNISTEYKRAKHGASWLCMGHREVLCCPPQIIRLKHAQDQSSILELPDYTCSANIMHEAPDTKAAKAAQEAPPGSHTTVLYQLALLALCCWPRTSFAAS